MKTNFLKLSLLSILALSFIVLTPSCDNDDNNTEKEQPQLEDVNIQTGYLPLPAAEYAKLPVAENLSLTKAYPASVRLNCPTIKNQGGEGSCVSWGVGYSARSISYKYANGGSYNNSVNVFSPEYIYNQIKVGDCNSGSYITSGLNLIKSQGVCTWNTMPYTDVDCDTYPNATQQQEAANYKISRYARVNVTINSIKDKLAAGKPVIVGGPVYYQFMKLRYNEVQTSTFWSFGGHCYCCVGYDDSKNAFLVQNSWGTSWGTNGFGWISYDIIQKVWNEAYVIYE